MSASNNHRLFDARHRSSLLDEVEGGTFDFVVVGGGINGAGVAHDAALRGLKVLLLEQRDLAFGTSSRSSKLIHGGLRYLEHYQFKLVFEGTNERAALRKIAPHLVRPILFALPVYEGSRPLWLMNVGLWMYDTLSLFKVEHRHITLRSPKRMLAREPLLLSEGLTGGIIYYDCVTDDARLTLENAMAAGRIGAPTVTHGEVIEIEGAETSKGTTSVRFRDRLSGREITVQGRVVVNCTGAWTDKIRRFAGPEDELIRPTKGVHLVLRKDRLDLHHANALIVPKDGRVFFALPWNDRTVIGTTDTDFTGDPNQIGVTKEDVLYLLEAANFYFPGRDLVPDDVIATWAGIRPLIDAGDVESASSVPREHKVYRDGSMVTIAGGKLTTYRRIAAEAVDEAAHTGGFKVTNSKTLGEKLPGAIGLDKDFDLLATELAESAGLEQDVASRLANIYGARGRDVAALAQSDPGLKERVCPDRDVIFAEVAHAVEAELALTVEDVLVRRTSLTLTAEDQALNAAERVAAVMGERLGWSSETLRNNVEQYEQAVALTRSFRDA